MVNSFGLPWLQSVQCVTSFVNCSELWFHIQCYLHQVTICMKMVLSWIVQFSSQTIGGGSYRWSQVTHGQHLVSCPDPTLYSSSKKRELVHWTKLNLLDLVQNVVRTNKIVIAQYFPYSSKPLHLYSFILILFSSCVTKYFEHCYIVSRTCYTAQEISPIFLVREDGISWQDSCIMHQACQWNFCAKQ